MLLGVLLLLAAYLAGARVAGAKGGWPWWRTLCFIVLGLGSIVGCTMPLAHLRHEHLWAVAVTLTLLLSVSPVCLALGDPVGLARAALPDAGARRLDRILASVPVRILTFPLVSAAIATFVLAYVFFSPILTHAVRSTTAMDWVYLLMLVVGLLTALPLLGSEILPAWMTDPVRMLFAFVDGIFDAIPGILVMTTSVKLAGGYYAGTHEDANWDAHVAGAAMLALTEVVTLPMLVLLFFRWAASETRRRPAEDPDEPLLSKPWWEQ